MDELERRIARYEWLKSQSDWHDRRFQKTGMLWHRRQLIWYRRQARNAATFTDHMAYAMRRRSHEMAANIASNSTLFARLCKL
jgi:hypothetical protein